MTANPHFKLELDIEDFKFECPVCEGELKRGNKKRELFCSEPNCPLISLRVDKNGNFWHLKYDAVMRNKITKSLDNSKKKVVSCQQVKTLSVAHMRKG